MKDPKWIGTSPTNPFWSQDSKSVFFGWNPTAQVADSNYRFALGSTEPVKAGYQETLKAGAIANGIYNSTNTQMVYTNRGDLFLVDLKTGATTRITQTDEFESNPKFVGNNEWVVYNKNQNLYGWNTKTGITAQLTSFRAGADAPAFGGFAGGAGGGRQGGGGQGFGGGGARPVGGAPTQGAGVAAGQTQDAWLQKNQLALSTILQERKQKRELRDLFLKSNKDNDTLKTISTGDKSVQNILISPDGRFVTYRLMTAPAQSSKNTIVPDYLAESGYTSEINGRTKVGNALPRYESYVYDKQKEAVYQIATDSLPGITDQPDYVKDYPQRRIAPRPRPVQIAGPFWNEAGTAAVVDIRSQDNKDRWIMQLNPETGKLSLIDRQRDEAWIGGPGISAFGPTVGWVNNDLLYFQSEKTGYSHLYTHDIKTGTRKALTEGKYEVQNLVLSKNKQYFYLLTNEKHPGKQHWYRLKTDGSKKEQITQMDGGYEVSLSPDEKWIAYRYSYINKPWELYIQENAPGKNPIQVTNKAQSEAFKSYAWRDTKITTITARDGQPIYTRVYDPKPGTKNGAAVIFVHGAGYLQNVHYGWSSYFREQMFNNLLADKGYTVIDIDYRASSGYGRDWRTGIYRFMGGKDLDDEVDAAKWLTQTMGIDSNRIGMYGGSYGGFMTLMAMFTQPNVIKAGAALRPVTDWAHYNHGYTANILNEPVNDSIAYAKSSPINFAAGLKNHLLICHGMVDVNVHFQDAVRLNQRLIELGKENWEMAVYPVEDHGFVEPSSWADEYKRILKLFETYLK
ncbi:MAG: S9 family peptidase [Chitinophagaceae bacterium BSSC1]|nr:MAG: S9 family peptidase [Chitinophagaceae bacterium BSSC1]